MTCVLGSYCLCPQVSVITVEVKCVMMEVLFAFCSFIRKFGERQTPDWMGLKESVQVLSSSRVFDNFKKF